MRTCFLIALLLAGFTLTGCGNKEAPKESPAKDAPEKKPRKGSGTSSSIGSGSTLIVDAGLPARSGSTTR